MVTFQSEVLKSEKSAKYKKPKNVLLDINGFKVTISYFNSIDESHRDLKFIHI